MGKVEKFLAKVESIEFVAMLSLGLGILGILAYFDPLSRIMFFTLLAGVAIVSIFEVIDWVIARWEAKRLVELIKEDAKEREMRG